MRPAALLAMFLFASLAGVTADDGQKEVDRIVGEFKKATQALKALSANLEGSKVCKMMEFREDYKATLKMQRPKKLRIDYTEPYKELRVVNGDVAWIYEPEMNQAQRIDLSRRGQEVRGATPLELAFSGNVDELRRDYNITLVKTEKTEKGKTVYTLELKPKGEEVEAKYRSIQFKMKEGVWVPFEIVTTNLTGDTVETYILKDLKINPWTLGWNFNWKPPLGVDVVNPLQ
ncbi:MAG: outer membrane lipoprotein carrier protein LolA [Planctomycetes bacterium]|nr:outer membrane lipoprotein carrier protein LolA [Planctomycetota bacterium]